MNRRNKHSRKNFTLVEMVVAMAVMVVVALIIGTAASTFYNGWKRSTRITEQLKSFVAIDQLMDQNVRNLIPFKWRDDQDEQRFVFEGERDSMLFATLRRSYPGDRGALLFVRIRLDGDELVAEYSNYPRPQWRSEGELETTREVVATNVRNVSFLYAEEGEEEPEFLDSWIEEDHAAVPLAIQMTVEWNDGRKEQWLRRTAGSSGRSVFGNRQTVN